MSGDGGHRSDDEDALQLGLVRAQMAMAKTGTRAIVVLEGRDAAGKDGAIKAITDHLSVRNTRVIALPKPSDRERGQWYWQRYVTHFPAAGELVIFNRSWYNRAGVEVVNGFSTAAEQEQFLSEVPALEAMLVDSGIALVKFWLDIDKDEQEKRLRARRENPLKALKVSPLDAVALDKWDAYTAARDTMLARTHSAAAPWTCVRADRKKHARRAIIQHLLRTIGPDDVADNIKKPDPDTLFSFEAAAIGDGRLAR